MSPVKSIHLDLNIDQPLEFETLTFRMDLSKFYEIYDDIICAFKYFET